MNKAITVTLFCLFIGLTSLQAQKMKITSKSENGNIVYVGKNTTSTGFYIMLTITGSGFVMDRENGTEQYVPAYGEKRLAVLTPSGGGISCHMKARYSDHSFAGRSQSQPRYTRPAASRSPQASAAVPVSTKSNAKNLIMFTQNGCSRSQYTRDYLRKNHISFQDYNVANSTYYMNLMWKKLEEAGYFGKSTNMPVAIVDGKVYHNIADLKGFLEGLKQRN